MSEEIKPEEVMTYASFLSLLNEDGLSFEEENGASREKSILSVVSNVLRFDKGQFIEVFEYTSSQEMEEDSKHIDDNGSAVKGAEIDWAYAPHWFKKDRVLILFIGKDESILAVLNKSVGDEFAGYGYIRKVRQWSMDYSSFIELFDNTNIAYKKSESVSNKKVFYLSGISA